MRVNARKGEKDAWKIVRIEATNGSTCRYDCVTPETHKVAQPGAVEISEDVSGGRESRGLAQVPNGAIRFREDDVRAVGQLFAQGAVRAEIVEEHEVIDLQDLSMIFHPGPNELWHVERMRALVKGLFMRERREDEVDS